MSRFSLSANNFYSTLSHHRPATSNIKARHRLASTGQTLMPHRTSSQLRPTTPLMIRSASSSFKNTRGKLDTLADRLQTVLSDVDAMRTLTKEHRLKVEFIREESIERGIQPLEASLMQKIKQLDKSIKKSRRSDALRFETLHQTCRALGHNARNIKGQLQEMSQRIYEVENVLGFHGVREKLKY